MEVFKAGKKTYVAVDVKLTKKQAIREANKHFHKKLDSLKCASGSLYKDELYLEPRSKGKTVWVVSIK